MNQKYRSIGCLVLLLSASAGCRAQSGAGALRPLTRPDSVYVAFIKQALEAPEACDYTNLRMAYTETSFYDPYSREDTTERIMRRAFIKEEHAVAIEAAEKILAANFLDARAHIVSSISYHALGDSVKSAFHDAVAKGLIRSILDSGDGRSFETAFVVIAVSEEYILLEVMGLRSNEQHLIEHEGSAFDRLKAADIHTNDTTTVYFNVDIPLRWWNRKHG